uniref:site-2 protease family protein n=1 Tax=Ndongobacter massiliensis TaxID=1871025 RepID=UPI00093141DC|nr:site-2 protease family protein [Ndongobacter massiliensis]
MFDWNLSSTVARVLALIYTITSHECAHALMALWNGDTTARDAGRLTLNPLSHLDPIGAFCLLFFRFGWAKPVPINARNFHHVRSGLITTALAGVTINLLSAFLAMALQLLLPNSLGFLQEFLSMVTIYGIAFCVFNLLPIPPLDGSRVLTAFLPRSIQYTFARWERYSFFLLLVLLGTGALQRILIPLTQMIWTGMLHILAPIFS